MKPLLVVTGVVLTAILLASVPVRAQQTPVWPCDERCQEAKRGMLYANQGGTVIAYSVRLLGQGLVLSQAGKRFAYRASWGHIRTKKTYKESELQKIERSGVQVIRLHEGATQDYVDFAMWQYGRTERISAICLRTYNEPSPNGPYK